MADPDFERETIEVANLIEAACHGRLTASVLMALSMVIGASAARAQRPDFDRMMKLVEQAARSTFEKELRRKSHG